MFSCALLKSRTDSRFVSGLQSVAKRVIDAQRGLHDEFVFVASKGKPRKPILAELIRAANAVLKTQESTLLRVVTRKLQMVQWGKSRAKVAQNEKRASSYAANPL